MPFIIFFPIWNFFGYSLLLITLTTCQQKNSMVDLCELSPKAIVVGLGRDCTGQFHTRLLLCIMASHLLRHVWRETPPDGNLPSEHV